MQDVSILNLRRFGELNGNGEYDQAVLFDRSCGRKRLFSLNASCEIKGDEISLVFRRQWRNVIEPHENRGAERWTSVMSSGTAALRFSISEFKMTTLEGSSLRLDQLDGFKLQFLFVKSGAQGYIHESLLDCKICLGSRWLRNRDGGVCLPCPIHPPLISEQRRVG